ncbi:MAG TPA: GNAT family N-acetyltransferase [Nitriliruptorales bacterium]
MPTVSPATGPAVRPYDKDRDLDAVKRIWREIGWATSDEESAVVEPFYDAGRTLVYELGGAAESAVHLSRGRIRYQDDDLVLAAVTAVTTSHVARKRGAARQLLARMLAEEASTGAHVSALGTFDQGFYDHLGFGTGPYEHKFTFDPMTLLIDRAPRSPIRVGKADWRELHACLLDRLRWHGGVCLDDPLLLKAELGSSHDEPFGLGYRDDEGRLTHFLFGRAKGEHGPYEVTWLSYQDVDQLLELLALLRMLGDQVHEVSLIEPPRLQLQDLLRTPFREGRRTRGEPFQRSVAWWQLRILDLDACLAAAHLPGDDLRFNLELHDPALDHVPDHIGWEGTAGSSVVTLGATCGREPGRAADLPTLRTGVGALSRLLFGVRDATTLAATTDLTAGPELLAGLDRAVRLPQPRFAWDF